MLPSCNSKATSPLQPNAVTAVENRSAIPPLTLHSPLLAVLSSLESPCLVVLECQPVHDSSNNDRAWRSAAASVANRSKHPVLSLLAADRYFVRVSMLVFEDIKTSVATIDFLTSLCHFLQRRLPFSTKTQLVPVRTLATILTVPSARKNWTTVTFMKSRSPIHRRLRSEKTRRQFYRLLSKGRSVTTGRFALMTFVITCCGVKHPCKPTARSSSNTV